MLLLGGSVISSVGFSKKLVASPLAPGPDVKSSPVILRSLSPPLLIGWRERGEGGREREQERKRERKTQSKTMNVQARTFRSLSSDYYNVCPGLTGHKGEEMGVCKHRKKIG